MFSFKLDEEVSSILGIDDHSSTPERRLLAALLERAILDFVGNDAAEVAAAEEWIFAWQTDQLASDKDSNFGPLKDFSFRWVCHYLDLNPYKVAAFIKEMPKRGSHRVAPWYFSKDKMNHGKAFASIR